MTRAPSRVPSGLAEGTVLHGTYQILRRVASGGMGDVYEAAHLRLPGRFAIKVLHPELVSHQDAFSRFCREAEIMSRLRHPNIVQIFDFNQTVDGTPYLVMEFVEGSDLDAWLHSRQRALGEVVTIVKQIAAALAAAHAHGVVHRDLKPENILVCRVEGSDQFVKVLDFGISRATWAGHLTGASIVMGTAQYMSPEQAQGRSLEVDGRSDVFALGSITYELLAGVRPFRGETPVAVLYEIVHEDPPPLSDYVSWPCARVEAVLRRALAKRKEERYGSALELARALEAAATDVYLAVARSPRVLPANRQGGEGDRSEAAALATARDAEADTAPFTRDELAWTGRARRGWLTLAVSGTGLAAALLAVGWRRPLEDARFLLRQRGSFAGARVDPPPAPPADPRRPVIETLSPPAQGASPPAEAASLPAAVDEPAPAADQPPRARRLRTGHAGRPRPRPAAPGPAAPGPPAPAPEPAAVAPGAPGGSEAIAPADLPPSLRPPPVAPTPLPLPIEQR